MKTRIQLLITAAVAVLIITGCSTTPDSSVRSPNSGVRATNSVGRVFLRTTNHPERKPGTVGPSQEWQPVDDMGPGRPVYLRELSIPGVSTPPTFIRAF